LQLFSLQGKDYRIEQQLDPGYQGIRFLDRIILPEGDQVDVFGIEQNAEILSVQS
jgi:hypothetical protein